MNSFFHLEDSDLKRKRKLQKGTAQSSKNIPWWSHSQQGAACHTCTFDFSVLFFHPGAHGPREALHHRVHEVKFRHVVHVRAVRFRRDLLQFVHIRVFHPWRWKAQAGWSHSHLARNSSCGGLDPTHPVSAAPQAYAACLDFQCGFQIYTMKFYFRKTYMKYINEMNITVKSSIT